MNGPDLRLSPAVGVAHPAVLNRRIRDLLVIGLTALIPMLIALAISVAMPSANLLLVLGSLAGIVGVVALMVSTRLDVTVVLLVIYCGMLDGPLKLSVGAHEVTAAIRNVLILAVCLGAVMRIVVRRERVSMPPMFGWVFAFVLIAVVEVFNPKTNGVLHIIGGFRQQLQFVPFFFFGYLLLRSKKRFRQLFLIVGVIGLANGVVSAYQTGLTPDQLAGWGPGYHNLIFIPSESKGTGRTYVSEGESRVRPPGLGSEAGFSGGVGVIALPMCLALLTLLPARRRWVGVILCMGALVAIITGLGRLQLTGAFLAVAAFAGLASIGGQRVARTIGMLLAIMVLAIPTGLLLVSVLRPGTFKRYEKINPTSSGTTLHKEGAWKLIPHYIEVAPFGFGLGSVGPVSGLGGKNKDLVEGHGVSSETQYNLIVNELGAPGLTVWVALSLFMIVVIVRGMRRARDTDIVIELAATFAPFFALFFEASSGPLSNSAAAGPYFWFAVGAAGYWFVGPRPGVRRPELAAAPGAPDGPAPLAIAGAGR
jgi:hypothetical protein